MKKWYLFYANPSTIEKLQQLVGELQSSINQTRIKLHQVGGEILKQPTSVLDFHTNVEFPHPPRNN